MAATMASEAHGRGDKSGEPGLQVGDGKLGVLHQGASIGAADAVELRVLDAAGRALTLWSGACSLVRSSMPRSVRWLYALRFWCW